MKLSQRKLLHKVVFDALQGVHHTPLWEKNCPQFFLIRTFSLSQVSFQSRYDLPLVKFELLWATQDDKVPTSTFLVIIF